MDEPNAGQRRLLNAIWQSFKRERRWPRFVGIDQVLDREELNARELIASMPPGLMVPEVQSSSHLWLPRANDELWLKVPGLRYCDDTQPELELLARPRPRTYHAIEPDGRVARRFFRRARTPQTFSPPVGGYAERTGRVTASSEARQPLRILVADEHPTRLDELEAIARGLGHDVIARENDAAQVAHLTRRHRPDLALVGLDQSSEHALVLIGSIVHEAACPVIAVLSEPNPEFVADAARRGVFAYVDHAETAEFESAIELALQRFAAFRSLEGAFGRRALIERAKGILMERHQIGERDAFELLRRRARGGGRKLTNVATAVVESHALLPARTPPEAGDDEPAR